MTNSELKELARSELVKILQSDSDKAFTAKCKLIQLVLTDQLEPPQAPEASTSEVVIEESSTHGDELPDNVLQMIKEARANA